MGYTVTYKPHYRGKCKSIRAYIRWNGHLPRDGPFFRDIYIQQCSDGGIVIKLHHPYLYSDEQRAFAQALNKLIEDRETECQISRTQYKALLDLCKDHCGPKEAICGECGERIGAYESRWYGPKSAACVECLTAVNRRLYPLYYTDG